jgi:hypothetical protein
MATEICGGANSAAPVDFCGRLTSVDQRDSRRYHEAYRFGKLRSGGLPDGD